MNNAHGIHLLYELPGVAATSEPCPYGRSERTRANKNRYRPRRISPSSRRRNQRASEGKCSDMRSWCVYPPAPSHQGPGPDFQHHCTCHSVEGQVMTNIIQFPMRGNSPPAPDPPSPSLQPPHLDGARGKAILSLVKGVWVVTVLVWPLLKRIVSLDVLFQLIRMVHHWSTTGVYAIWTFLLHFAVLTALTCFVSLYKPKGI